MLYKKIVDVYQATMSPILLEIIVHVLSQLQQNTSFDENKYENVFQNSISERFTYLNDVDQVKSITSALNLNSGKIIFFGNSIWIITILINLFAYRLYFDLFLEGVILGDICNNLRPVCRWSKMNDYQVIEVFSFFEILRLFIQITFNRSTFSIRMWIQELLC